MPPRSSDRAASSARWHVRVLGTLTAADGQQTLTRFGGASVAALLARLAMYPRRSHAREELVELLWPGIGPEVGRNRLRQALFALRTLLEPPGPVAAPVLIADRTSVRVHEGAIECDAVAFELALREGRHADALALYGGELLPGHYDDWIADERLRLAALAERADARLAAAAPLPIPGPQRRDDHDPPAAARRERSTLPVYLTRCFGREADVARLRDALASTRLLTLLGAGGAGKTRLAVEAVQALRDDAGPDGGFDPLLFVPLAGCTTRDALLDALRAGLRLPAEATDKLGPIVDALAERRALLVLDNFEQLVEAGADAVAQLVARLPGLHLLVTSQRPLGLDGEHAWVLAPLPAPADGASLAEASASPAVALFVDRARAARTDFHLGERNRVALIELARVLEGLPLAIELAASRIRSVSPAEMLAHLRSSNDMQPDGAPRRPQLDLLARGGTRAGPDARHSSMQRAIEWSWQLLAPPARRLLAELTVFAGGLTAAAAGAVATPEAMPIALRLDELVAHSLLAAAPAEADGPTRYQLAEPVREYAAATLSADDLRALRGRHRAWVEHWGAALPLTPPLDALRAELRNLGAALASALADGRPDEGVRLLVAWRRGLPDTGVPAGLLAQAAEALQRCTDIALASRGHTLLGRLCLGAGQGEAARHHADTGLALARRVAAIGTDSAELLARALHGAASADWRTLRQAARPLVLLDEAEPLAAQLGEPGLRASLLALRAFITNIAQRDLARAEALHAQALALWEEAGDAISANNGRYNLAVCALRARRFAQVLAQLDLVAAEATALHDWRLLSQAHNVAGEAHWGLRQWAAAAAAYRRSVELAWSTLAQQPLAYALWNLPHALARQRDPERAARLGAAAERFWVAQIGPLDAADQRQLRLLRRLVAVQIGPARTEAAWRAGAALGAAAAVALALQTQGLPSS
jgi:predicted ATPase